ncbi:MAG TPA: autotransporter domain-containing protein [Xanthomonadaceae bacterium]|nr:autotransporter domain-containing protein [Xanthomonadaceae bacterium]
MAFLLPGAAHAICEIVSVAPTFQSGEPSEPLVFSFEIRDDGVPDPDCDDVNFPAIGTITITTDTTGGAVLDRTAFTGGPGIEMFTLTLGTVRGGFVQIDIECTGGGSNCGASTRLTYFAEVKNQFAIKNVDPADGTTQTTPNSIVDYTIEISVNGNPGGTDGAVCFEITSNPAGDAVLINPAAAKGFVCTSPGAVSVNPDFTSGLATVQLDVGSAATQPVQVIAYPSEDPSVMAAAAFATTPTLQAVTASPITSNTGVPFDVEVRTVDIDGAAMSGQPITFTANDPALTPASANVSTDTGGSAVVSFTGNQAGTYGQGVVATFDPSPASPGSGDEQTVTFDVIIEDVVVLSKPATGSGDNQTANTGEAFAQPLTALVQRNGNLSPGETVGWEVVSGPASVDASTSVTDSNGEASVGVTAGATAGTVQIRAFLVSDPTQEVFYSLEVVGGELLQIVSGQGQIAPINSTSEPLVVRYSISGTPTSGAQVTWTLESGQATLSATSTTTDAAGETSITVEFGSTAGRVTIRADAPGADPVRFLLTVRDPAFGGRITLVSGAGQRGAILTRGDEPIVAEIRAEDGSPIEGILVHWEVVSGSLVLDAESAITGADGRSSMGFRHGSTAGPSVVRASLSGGGFVDALIQTVTPLISQASGDGQTGPVSTPLQEDFVIQIALPPVAAKALDGVPIQWQVLEGGGQLQSATTLTDTDGQARNRLTLGPDPGVNRVRATVPDGGSVEFTATGVTGDGNGELRIVSGNNQTLPTNQASAPLVVEFVDASGAIVQGATLQWSGQNATLEDESTVTGADGRSSNLATVQLPGTASVTVTEVESGVSTVFTLTGGVANTPGLQEQQVTVGDAIDALCPALFAMQGLTPEQADLLARCLELVEGSGDSPGDVADALQELIQDVALTQVNSAMLIARAQFDNLNARIAALRSGASGGRGLALQTSDGLLPLSLLPGQDGESGGAGSEVGADFSRWGFFAAGTIGRGEVEAGGSRPEYDFDTAGLTAGVDYRVNDALIAGAAVGYAQHDVDVAGNGGMVETTGWSVSAYGTWYRNDSWYVDGVLSYGSNSYDIERRIVYEIATSSGVTRVDQTATADSDGSQISFAVSVGRDFQRGAWNLGPYLRATYTRVDFDSYEESLISGQPGAGLGLAVDPRDMDSVSGVLGGKVTYTMSRDWGVLMPHLNVEWEHQFQDDSQRVVSRFLHDPTRTAFVIDGEETDSDYFNIGFGLSALWPGGKSAFVYYEHLVGNDDVDQGNLAIGIRIEF